MNDKHRRARLIYGFAEAGLSFLTLGALLAAAVLIGSLTAPALAQELDLRPTGFIMALRP